MLNSSRFQRSEFFICHTEWLMNIDLQNFWILMIKKKNIKIKNHSEHSFQTYSCFFLPLLPHYCLFFPFCFLSLRSGSVEHCYFASLAYPVLCFLHVCRYLLQIRFYFNQLSQPYSSSWSGALSCQFYCLARHMAFVCSHVTCPS